MKDSLFPRKALESQPRLLGKSTSRTTPSGADKAYAAGFFDGEGNITIAEDKGRSSTRGSIFNMRVGAAQNEIEPLIWLRERWGGTIRMMSRRTRTGRCTFQWWCFSKNAEKFLLDLQPYLQVKRERAKIALEFQSMLFNPGARGHTEEYRVRQRALRSEMVKLNSHKPFTSVSISLDFTLLAARQRPSKERSVDRAARVRKAGRFLDRIERNSLVKRSDGSATSGSFGNNLGRLRTLSTINYPTRGQVRAEDILFPQI